MDYDAIIIGTGQAGPALARRPVTAGRKVTIIERKLFAGTWVNTGCTPTKALVASTYAAHVARRAADYGVTIGGAECRHEGGQGAQEPIVGPWRNGVERLARKSRGTMTTPRLGVRSSQLTESECLLSQEICASPADVDLRRAYDAAGTVSVIIQFSFRNLHDRPAL
jgi:choline dehydrogenase-like flavoprotein